MMDNDRAPILVVLHPTWPKSKGRFKFQNRWLSREDIHDVAIQTWFQNSSKPIHQHTKALTTTIKIGQQKETFEF